MAFVMFGLEVHPTLIIIFYSFDQGPFSHFAFALRVGCSKYKHSYNHDLVV
jgi:hypothetical protein